MKAYRITKSQVLHLLTVFVLTPLAGYVAAWVPKHFPGMPHFTSSQLTVVFVTGAGTALTAGIHYLHGWQLWERTGGKVIDVQDKVAPPALEGHLLEGAPLGPAVTIHVHGANPSGQVTAEGADTTVQEHGGNVPGGTVTQTPPAPAQPVSTPPTEKSSSITGM